MKAVAFEDGAVQIDATIVAEGLGMTPPDLLARMQTAGVTGVCEHGIDADGGRHRLTFFSGNRRFRVVVDQRGAIVRRSTLDFGDRPLPASAHRRGG
jgi:hypothetical protein